MADKKRKAPAKTVSSSSSRGESQSGSTDSLLNSYLKSSASAAAPAPAASIKRPKVKQLGDLQDLLHDQPSSIELAAGVKQLGSIQALLRGKTTPLEAEIIPDTVNPYQKNDFTAASTEAHSPDTPVDASAFAPDKNNDANRFNYNLPLFAGAIFGIGACVFGISQLIQNVNRNFASEDSDPVLDQTPVTPPRILTFQGRLSDDDQQSITSPKRMRFTLYNTSGGNTPPPVGGEVLWDSNFCTVVPNQSGIFTVNLGAGNGDGGDDYNCGQTLGNIFSQNSNIWLEITVDDEVLFPRQLIKSVPYALNSETLQGYSASASATANTIPVLDGNGNLHLGTNRTSIVNLGSLGLVSQTGDIYLLPGSGTVYVGNAQQATNLYIAGDATLSGRLNLSTSRDPSVIYGDQGLFFKSSAGQTWQTVTIDKNGYLGLGTTTPRQKLTINNGSIAFETTAGPDISRLSLTEDITDPNALRRIDSPTDKVDFQTQSEAGSRIKAGKYRYAYTYVTADGGETALSPISEFEVGQDNQTILINNLKTSNHPAVVARNLYRSHAGKDELYFVKTIPDNTSSTTFDNANDDELNDLPTNLNTTGVYHYRMTYVTNRGETSPSAESDPIKVTGDGRVIKITNLPIVPNNSDITARRLYRSLANSDQYFLVAELTDNTVNTVYDNISDYSLVSRDPLSTAGGIYVNNRVALQFGGDGKIVARDDVVAEGRLEAAYGDKQGLKLPTSAGKPFAKIGQQIGDIVYDSVGQVLYIYNGVDFVPTGLNSDNSVHLTDTSNCTGNICRIVLDAEYAGAVVTGDGTNNNGSFTSGSETVGDSYRFNYYAWQSADPTTLNDFDTTINLTIPQNFLSWQDEGLTLDFLTSSSQASDNFVQLEVYRGGTAIGITKTDLTSTTANTWMSHAMGTQPATITGEQLSTLGFSPGDVLTLKIKTASQNGQLVKIGQVNLNYLTQDGIIDTGSQSLWKQVAGAIFPADSTNDFLLGGEATTSAKIGFLNLSGQGTPTLLVRGNLFLGNTTGQNYLDLAEQSSFNIRSLNADNTTTHFTILPNGNIGIGTTTPTEKLEVEGNVKVNGSLQLNPISAEQAGECNATTEGKIYYDIAQGAFFACQATDNSRTAFSWESLN